MAKTKTGVRVVFNKLLRAWFVVTGPHEFPLAGPFEARAEALKWLGRDAANEYRRRYSKDH